MRAFQRVRVAPVFITHGFLCTRTENRIDANFCKSIIRATLFRLFYTEFLVYRPAERIRQIIQPKRHAFRCNYFIIGIPVDEPLVVVGIGIPEQSISAQNPPVIQFIKARHIGAFAERYTGVRAFRFAPGIYNAEFRYPSIPGLYEFLQVRFRQISRQRYRRTGWKFPKQLLRRVRALEVIAVTIGIGTTGTPTRTVGISTRHAVICKLHLFTVKL